MIALEVYNFGFVVADEVLKDVEAPYWMHLSSRAVVLVCTLLALASYLLTPSLRFYLFVCLFCFRCSLRCKSGRCHLWHFAFFLWGF